MAELGTQSHLDCIAATCNCLVTISYSIWASPRVQYPMR